LPSTTAPPRPQRPFRFRDRAVRGGSPTPVASWRAPRVLDIDQPRHDQQAWVDLALGGVRGLGTRPVAARRRRPLLARAPQPISLYRPSIRSTGQR
jgi:hypothetical protein